MSNAGATEWETREMEKGVKPSRPPPANRVCQSCKGKGCVEDGDPEVGSRTIDCDGCAGSGYYMTKGVLNFIRGLQKRLAEALAPDPAPISTAAMRQMVDNQALAMGPTVAVCRLCRGMNERGDREGCDREGCPLQEPAT